MYKLYFSMFCMMFVLSISFTTEAKIIAQTNFSRDDSGNKEFSKQWFDFPGTGIVSFALDWTNFIPKKGFDLGKAKRFEINFPNTLPKCSIILDGVLYATMDGKQPNPFSLRFDGIMCKPSYDNFAKAKPTIITFYDVPDIFNDQDITPELTLLIDDLP